MKPLIMEGQQASVIEYSTVKFLLAPRLVNSTDESYSPVFPAVRRISAL